MAPVSKGSVELRLPTAVVEECHGLTAGQKLELSGTNCKQGAKKSDDVKILAEKTDEFLLLTLHSTSMGAVFHRKLADIWNCEIKSSQLLCDPAVDVEQPALSDDEDNTVYVPVEIMPKEEAALEEAESIEAPPLAELADEDDFCNYVKMELERVKSATVSSVDPTAVKVEVEDKVLAQDDDDEDTVEPVETEVEPQRTTRSTRKRQNTSPKPTKKKGKAAKKAKGKTESPAHSANIKIETTNSPEKSTTGKSPRGRKRATSGRKSFKPRNRPKVKIPEVNDVSELKCQFCERSWFCSVQSYSRHINCCTMNPDAQLGDEVKEEQLFTCEVCNMKSKSLSMLKRHRREIHNLSTEDLPASKDMRPCKFCGESFPMGATLFRHQHFKCQKNPNRRTPYECRKCRRTFRSAEQLQCHKQKNSCEEVCYMCDICGKWIKSSANLKAHKLRHNADESQKQYICHSCPKAYYSRRELSQHEAKHSDARSHPCPHCDKTFKHRQHLTRHTRTIHEKKYRFKCEICGHGVEERSFLRAHICGRIFRPNGENDKVDKALFRPNHLPQVRNKKQKQGQADGGTAERKAKMPRKRKSAQKGDIREQDPHPTIDKEVIVDVDIGQQPNRAESGNVTVHHGDDETPRDTLTGNADGVMLISQHFYLQSDAVGIISSTGNDAVDDVQTMTTVGPNVNTGVTGIGCDNQAEYHILYH